MKRSAIQRSTPLRSRPKPVERQERVRPPVKPVERRGVYRQACAVAPVPKPSMTRDQRIRDSARGEDCTVRLPGCPRRPDMTIWSHHRGSAGGKGMGMKSSDRAGAYACTYCDAVYDGQHQRPAGMTKAEVDLAWHEGHIRSLLKLEQKGLL
jgi:hypothetical protein